ncbi:hypothetical protein MKX29_09255 [Cytobacillus sp. FSL R7-0696]|uniref:hypothetical protein n=1 Tax=Cytobacillus sp. FSL R7-0696 TaxID=2921691 RepID=UPI0030FACE44
MKMVEKEWFRGENYKDKGAEVNCLYISGEMGKIAEQEWIARSSVEKIEKLAE